MITTIKLPLVLVNKLTNLPEQGMGYQIVNITLKGGQNLIKRTVINSTDLVLLDNESLTTNDIKNAELYKV